VKDCHLPVEKHLLKTMAEGEKKGRQEETLAQNNAMA
jgi:hypothetical protein